MGVQVLSLTRKVLEPSCRGRVSGLNTGTGELVSFIQKRPVVQGECPLGYSDIYFFSALV